MKRILVEDQRTVSLAWNKERCHFEFRLLYGKTFLTPVLLLETFAMNGLLNGEPVRMGTVADRNEIWLRLIPRLPNIEVDQIRDLKGDPRSRTSDVFGNRWCLLDLQDFYLLAEEERGDKPEKGVRLSVGSEDVTTWLDRKKRAQ